MSAATPADAGGKKKKKRRKGRNEKAPAQPAQGVRSAGRSAKTVAIPAQTGFDLLEGAFVKVARARLLRLVAIGMVAIGMVFGALQIVLVRVEAGEYDRQQAEADTTLISLKRQVAELANTGGLSREQMEGHLDRLGTSAVKVTYGDLAVQTLLDEVALRTPGNITVTSVATSSSVDPSGVATHAITLSASAPGFEVASQYRDVLRASPLLSDVSLSWAGASDNLTVTVTAKLAPTAVTTRATQYRAQFDPDFDPSKAAAPPTPSEGTEAQSTEEEE